MRYYLYVAKNDGIIHLAVKLGRKKYQLICNNNIRVNKHRISKDGVGVFLIAPKPVRKHRCANCERRGIKLFKQLKMPT